MSRISTVYKGDCHFESMMGNHRLIVDMPESMGGKDRGPMPPQLFAASLGSCVGVLITDFCHHHELSPEGLEVHVDYNMSQKPLRMTDIKVTVELPHAACDDACMKKALAHVAEHCPVHETIASIEDVDFTIHFGDK